MDSTTLTLITAIVPTIIASVATYFVSKHNSKTEMDKTIASTQANLLDTLTSVQTEMRIELRKELLICKEARDEISNLIEKYRIENAEMKKELQIYKEENETLRKRIVELEKRLKDRDALVERLLNGKKDKDRR